MLWFKRQVTPAERGTQAGRAFVASNPNAEVIFGMWSVVCEDHAVTTCAREYAEAWRAVVRPLWEKAMKEKS